MDVAGQIERFGNFFLDVIDGKYGWFDEVIALLFLVIAVNFFAHFVLKRLHVRYAKNKKHWKDSFVKALYKPLSYYVWFIAAINCVDLISHRVNGNPFFLDHHLHHVMSIGAILSFGWFLLRWKRNVVSFLIFRSERHEIAIDKGKIDLIGKLGTVGIVFVVLLLTLEVTERSMNTLIAFGGVSGLALAFASQELIANFFGGLMIYLTHPFAVGDWINLPERHLEGHVEEIGWYMTRIRTFDKRPVYVPNSTFSRIVVMTPSRMSHRHFKETIGIRYDDLPVIKKILSSIKVMVDQHSEIDHQQHALVHLHSFGPYSVEIMIEAYLIRVDTQGYAELREDLFFKIADIIAENGAEFAYPTTSIQIPAHLLAQITVPK